MAENDIIKHPSAWMVAGREAAREGDFDKLIGILLDIAPPGTVMQEALSGISSIGVLSRKDQVAATADIIIAHHGFNFDAAIAHAARISDRLPDSVFAEEVISTITARKASSEGGDA